jgi:alkanesulfonate monooxygenase SsuD/methylene tetrahydromethanopterin reductase-like flavin-dependent oxidoreductase (luciferase family)
MIKFGILPTPQHTTWPELRQVAMAVDSLGFASLWISDHLLPVDGTRSGSGPILEAFTTLAGLCTATRQCTIGTMVVANGFRRPALTAKMITMIDQMSGGRAVLGIGAGWIEDEHAAIGVDFPPVPRRLELLEEALVEIRRMTGAGPGGTPSLPLPLQPRLPILVGAAGEKRALRLVALYADIWNLHLPGGTLADIERKRDALFGWCAEVGRDPTEIELSYHVGPVVLRAHRTQAASVLSHQLQRMAVRDPGGIAKTPEDLIEALTPIVSLGFRHLYFDALVPYDIETLHWLRETVQPALAELSSHTAAT